MAEFSSSLDLFEHIGEICDKLHLHCEYSILLDRDAYTVLISNGPIGAVRFEIQGQDVFSGKWRELVQSALERVLGKV